jgi:hypothetical protein
MKKALISAGVLFALPWVAFGADPSEVYSLHTLVLNVIGIINNLIVPLIFGLAFLVFVWGAFKVFIIGATSEKLKEDGKNLMLWSMIGFFVMLSVWGIVNVIAESLVFRDTVLDPAYFPEATNIEPPCHKTGPLDPCPWT